ncbi:hypothetical protein [Tenacibaculum sp.]|uniref:hypothetical protein n=1 Tax=Tenacibaculum sp. TaxID=1906242 RepID=UPI003D0BCDD3
MKKSILILGKTLNKIEQKQINGGRGKHCCSWRNGECVYWEEIGVTCPFLP